jgi:hypothetical protein
MSDIGCAIHEAFFDSADSRHEVNLFAWEWSDQANPNNCLDAPPCDIWAAILEFIRAYLSGCSACLFNLVPTVGSELEERLSEVCDAQLASGAARVQGRELAAKLASLRAKHGTIGKELHFIGHSHGGALIGTAASQLATSGTRAASVTCLDTPKVTNVRSVR